MRGRIWLVGACALAAAVPVAIESPAAGAATPTPVKQPTAKGRGGGAATMSPYATQSAIDVLKHGGNAVDAAVAAAATLGVTEPFVAGPGGGGFFVYRRASDRKVFTIDGREKAPAGARPDMFLDANGDPEAFETAVESGKSIGVPGQVATWAVALKHFGTRPLKRVLEPAEAIARAGFPLDQAGRSRRWATCCATPTSPTPTGASAATAGAGSTPGRSPRSSRTWSSIRPTPPEPRRSRPAR
jgi:gamma-glutamyltranspeptidase / glutathione hydrolase